jgi:hypothetical protein
MYEYIYIYILRVFKIKMLRRISGRGMHIGYWWESQKERDHWEDQDVSGWAMLKLILGR